MQATNRSGPSHQNSENSAVISFPFPDLKTGSGLHQVRRDREQERYMQCICAMWALEVVQEALHPDRYGTSYRDTESCRSGSGHREAALSSSADAASAVPWAWMWTGTVATALPGARAPLPVHLPSASWTRPGVPGSASQWGCRPHD
jgi:hypothetical protein